MLEMSLYVMLSTASVVSSSKDHSLFHFTDSAVTFVVVGRSFSFKTSSFRMDRAVTVGAKSWLKCLDLP